MKKAIQELQASQLEVANLKNAIVAKEEENQLLKETLRANETQFGASQKEVELLQATVASKEGGGYYFQGCSQQALSASGRTNCMLARDASSKS